MWTVALLIKNKIEFRKAHNLLNHTVWRPDLVVALMPDHAREKLGPERPVTPSRVILGLCSERF